MTTMRDLEEMAEGIVRLVEDDDGDLIDLFHQGAENLGLAPMEKGYLAEMLDLCPLHHCDVEICADDQVESCATVREEGLQAPVHVLSYRHTLSRIFSVRCSCGFLATAGTSAAAAKKGKAHLAAQGLR